MAERIFIGVAWPYANGDLHLGHVAGSYLPADIFGRYHRMRGNEVLMVSGSDCHGTPITLAAEAEGVSPQQVVDKYHRSFLESWRGLGVSFDSFTATGTKNHRDVASELWLRLHEKGFIYAGTMKVAYSPDFQRFLPDRYVHGICPGCGSPDARGDQCDNCGKTMDAVDLINPSYRRGDRDYPVQVREADHLFFRLSTFNDQLEDWVARQQHWRSSVRSFTLALLREGLQDRAVSRDIDWGVPLPLAGYGDKRIYVWFEAVIGYLSASKEWASSRGDAEAWRPFWQDPATRSYYFMGKDNITFHTVIWPAMLLAYGGLNLPYDVPANGFLTLEGRQFSTSRNWAVWLPDYLAQFPPDPLRYYLSAAMPEAADSDFSWAEYVRRNNDELVATYGNLVHRVLSLVYRNFAGRVPDSGQPEEPDVALMAETRATLNRVGASIGAVRLREALGGWMALAREANRYLDAREPWHQVRENLAAAARTLSTALYAIAGLKVLTYPFLPFSAQRLHELLGSEGPVERTGWTVVPPVPGTRLQRPEPLFAKLDDGVAEVQAAKLGHRVD